MTKTELKAAKERFDAMTKYIKQATVDNIVKETAAEQEARIKMLLKPKNYTKFFDYYFGIDTPISLADAPCSDFHQSSYETVFRMQFIKLLRKWYRGSAKSIHTNVGNIAHLKQNDELFFALLIGKNEGAAKLLLSDLQAHFQFNERYIKDFGMQMSYGNWSDGEFETKDNRFFKALGINQPFRGLRKYAHRPDFASVDDVEDRKLAKNKELVQEYGEKITGDLGKAFDFKRGRLIVPNNYIVKDGIMDFLKNKFKTSKNFREEIVNLSKSYTDHTPSWHQRLTKEDVTRINEDTDYYTSMREDYNYPIEEGKLFKEKWIRMADASKIKSWDGLLIHWDLSYKDTGDFKAGKLLGFKGSLIYVLKVFCRRCPISEAINWHFDLVQDLSAKGMSPLSFYDSTAAQGVVFKPLFDQEAARRKFYEVPMPMTAPGIDKHLRIEATLTNVFFNKRLVFDKKLEGTPDFEAGKTQILSFEKGTKAPDDFPDNLECGIRLGQKFFGSGIENDGNNDPIILKHKRGGF